MGFGLRGQVVLVTGAGRGIGREVAVQAASSGASVALVARTREQLEEVSAVIRADGGDADCFPADLIEPSASDRVVEATLERWGRIDVLVNNAGTNRIASLVTSKEEHWREVFELNVFALFRCTRAALKSMIRARAGRIVNVSSISGKSGAAYSSAYASSKAAVIGFTKSIARETARLGITVNAVCPWHVDTALIRTSMESRARITGQDPASYLRAIIERSPQRRLVEAHEVAAVCLFLMSQEAQGITGQAIDVTAGMVVE